MYKEHTFVFQRVAQFSIELKPNRVLRKSYNRVDYFSPPLAMDICMNNTHSITKEVLSA